MVVQKAVCAGERDPARAVSAGLEELRRSGAEIDYLEIVSPETMAPVAAIDEDVLVVVAARIGNVRLIDNLTIHELSTGRSDGGSTAASANGGQPSSQPTAAGSINDWRQ
jgi:pantoate--beta-alanine ligase